MIAGIIFDKDDNEREVVSGCVRECIANKTDEESRIFECGQKKDFLGTVSEADINDFCCMDFLVNEGKEYVSAFRKNFPDSALLLLVDAAVSPMAYVRPDIMPSAIILKPSGMTNIKATITEFLDSVISTYASDDSNCLIIDTREGVTRVAFDQISYVEASAKKVFIRTKKEEYGYYNTLDHLEEILPDYFIRCHRGYIVNTHKVDKYVGAENLLYLRDGSVIPVSRSYKGTIREVIK